MNQLAVSTVLTVEDDPIVRDDLRTLFEREGFEVLAGARDGVEAVELAREHRPDVILSTFLPRLGGVEAARDPGEKRDVPIVALTGYSERLVGQALEAGASAYVRKPFAGGEVVTALRDALQSHAERSIEARRGRSRQALIQLGAARLPGGDGRRAGAARVCRRQGLEDRGSDIGARRRCALDQSARAVRIEGHRRDRPAVVPGAEDRFGLLRVTRRLDDPAGPEPHEALERGTGKVGEVASVRVVTLLGGSPWTASTISQSVRSVETQIPRVSTEPNRLAARFGGARVAGDDPVPRPHGEHVLGRPRRRRGSRAAARVALDRDMGLSSVSFVTERWRPSGCAWTTGVRT